MTRSVFANNRNFSHKGSTDKSTCSAPDVCKTPMGSATPPIPYGVNSQVANLSQATSTVVIDGNPTAIASSIHTQCMGDQAGSATGLISGTVGDKTHFASYSFDVKAEGEGIVRHLDLTTMNNRNTIGMNYGAATAPIAIQTEKKEVEPIYTLRFEYIDDLGQPLKGVKYKAVPAGQKEELNIADGKTSHYGTTPIVSVEKGESIDCYLVWEQFDVKNNTSQG